MSFSRKKVTIKDSFFKDLIVMSFFFFCPIVLSSLPLKGASYCITVPVILAYIQSSAELRHRLSLVADIAISCSVVVVVLRSRVFLPLQEGPIGSG